MNLDDLFGKYTDKITEVYEDFMYEFESKGLQWGLMMRPEFFAVPADKSVVPFVLSLPLLTYSRINLALTKEEVSKSLAELKKKYETLPEFQGRELPKVPTIRDVLDQYFLVYPDDEVDFKITYFHKTLVHLQGKISDIKFNIKDLTHNKSIRVGIGDLMTVSITLLKKGEQRTDDEKTAYIGEGDLYVDNVLTARLQEKLSSLPEEVKTKRLELFSDMENPSLSDLPSTEVVVLDEMITALANPDYTNEQVLAQTNCMRGVNLDKMTDWLKRLDEKNEIF